MTDLESQVASVEGSLKMVNENYVGLRLEAHCIKSKGRTAEMINNVEILFHTRKNLLELTEIKAMLSRADGFLTQHRHLNESEGTQ